MKILAFILATLALPVLAYEGETEQSVSVSGTSARTAADLSTGIKEVDCDVAVYYRMGTSGATATTSDVPRAADSRFYVNITNDGRRLAFITDGGTGTCRIYPVNVSALSRAAGAMLFGPAPIGADLTLSGILTATSVFATAVVVNGNILANTGIQVANGPLIVGDGATKGGTLSAASSLLTIAGVTDGDVAVAASGAGLLTLDGASSASLGASTATSTTVGRTGQTTSLNGNVTFGTTGPNLGSTVTGAWSVYATGLLVAATTYGAFQISQSANNVKFRNVSCSHGVAGTSTNGTLAVRNVTDGTNLCTGSYTCTTTANTPTLIFDCNAAPTVGKMYALDFTTGCGITQVSGLSCNVEIAH